MLFERVLILISLLPVLVSSVPEILECQFMCIPFEIHNRIFYEYLDYASRLNFYATTSILYQRFKRSVRLSLMKPAYDGFKLSIRKIYKTWRTNTNRSDLQSLLETHVQIQYYKEYIFKGPVNHFVPFPDSIAGSVKKFFSINCSRCPAMCLLYFDIHPEILCILVELYPAVMLEHWGSLENGIEIIQWENPSKALLKTIFRLRPFLIQNVPWSASVIDIIHPAMFPTIIMNSSIKRSWNVPLIHRLFNFLESSDHMGLLLDLSPPKSIYMQFNLIQRFVKYRVSVHKVARCYAGCYHFMSFSFNLKRLLEWGVREEEFIRIVLKSYTDCTTSSVWSSELTALAASLGYSEHFCDFVANNFKPRNVFTTIINFMESPFI